MLAERNGTIAEKLRWSSTPNKDCQRPMPNEDCLNIRLGDYLDRHRDPLPEAATDAVGDEGDTVPDDAENRG